MQKSYCRFFLFCTVCGSCLIVTQQALSVLSLIELVIVRCCLLISIAVYVVTLVWLRSNVFIYLRIYVLFL